LLHSDGGDLSGEGFHALDGRIAGECSVEDSTVDVPMTSEDLSLKLIGMWITCGPSLFGTPTDDGIELNADHTWSKVIVYRGAFIRDQHADGSGTWQIAGSDTGNALILGFHAGNSMVLFPSFNIKTPTSVRRLHLVDARNSKNVQFVFNAP